VFALLGNHRRNDAQAGLRRTVVTTAVVNQVLDETSVARES
jgi:hypothetical protein